MGNLNKKLWKTRECWKEKYSGKRDYMTKRYSILPGILYFTKFVLYIIFASMVIKKQMTLDKLVLLISYFESIVTATDQTLEYLLNLNNYKVRMQRIRSIVDYPPQKEFDFGDIDNDYISGLIEFKKVSYQVKDVKALDNVSFKVYPNEINAIIGHSGSGKSTIINLLYRLHKVSSGTILIDNVSIYDYTNHIYASNVSGVYQKPFVFDMSIRDNLNLVDSNRNLQIEACKRVGLHDFIMSLPKGYNTIISEEDAIFSNGKKQLLAIARALLSKAEILLFDEITGNIDPETTNQILSILLDLKTDHTILMVTHKPEMMEIADHIIVLSNGKIECKGKNQEVYQKST
ncbi:MAG: ABC transporter ATP-binding protein/permease, partial [Bacilli bacterium]|nr:ABC transporter ATP-binding protein/permease [Bacilli bacterium]